MRKKSANISREFIAELTKSGIDQPILMNRRTSDQSIGRCYIKWTIEYRLIVLSPDEKSPSVFTAGFFAAPRPEVQNMLFGALWYFHILFIILYIRYIYNI